MPGQDAEDWVINNYVDLDPSGNTLDYMGQTGHNAKTYNGHNGIDIDVSSFREMDGNFAIYAVAPGEVTAFDDGHFDRNTSCVGSWNFVELTHANGFRTIYGHLKKNSVALELGQMLEAGDQVGVVGSSGCSTQPHLHLEIRDPSNRVVDPFLSDLWLSPPVYDTPLGEMDWVLRQGGISHIDQIKDPLPNVSKIASGQQLGIGLSMAGGEAGDTIVLDIRQADDSLTETFSVVFGKVYRHSYWYWNTPLIGPPGMWSLQLFLNGVLAKSQVIEVVDDAGMPFEQVRHGIPAASYQEVFDQMIGDGYRLVWVDAYNVGEQAFFNAIFDRSSSGLWWASHGLDSAGFQDLFETLTGQGYRLVHIDSYLEQGFLLYASLFIQQEGPAWQSYHEVTQEQHEANFASLVSQGYRPVALSFEEWQGELYVAGLYDQENVGAWEALAGLTGAQYQSAFDANVAAGRTLAYLNAYNSEGVPRFSAIWDSIGHTAWEARHGLTSAQFQNEFDKWSGAGYSTLLVTGHENAGSAQFGALWATNQSVIFVDGFESGNLSAWSQAVP